MESYIYPAKLVNNKISRSYNEIYIPKISQSRLFVLIDKNSEKEIIQSINIDRSGSRIVATRGIGESNYKIQNLPSDQAKILNDHINRPEFRRDIREKFRTLPLISVEIENNKIINIDQIRNNKTPPITSLFPPLAQSRPTNTPNPSPGKVETIKPNNNPNGIITENTTSDTQQSQSDTATIEQLNKLAQQKISDIAGYTEPQFNKRYGSILEYPLNLGSSGQDYIQFDIIKYNSRTVSEKNKFTFNKRYNDIATKDILISIILPIQPNASDTNSVGWESDGISSIELGVTGISASLQSGSAPNDVINGIMDQINKLGADSLSDDARTALRMFLSKQAVNPGDANKFMSRIIGSVINPNMELIFNSPKLRPFQFNFQLFPRSSKEGIRVRNIIRVFKEASAIRRGIGDLFLNAPYVFQLSYKTYKNGRYILHPSINKFKICALRNISVDYTPTNTYSTYTDGTMTAYVISLEFSEIEPIYADDYDDKNLNVVGY